MSRSGRRAKAKGLSTGAKRLIAIGIVLAVIVGVFYAYTASKPKPRLYADHSYYDLGTVPQTKISHIFTFSNTGAGDLTVTRIWTSCGCTTAKLELNGIASPEFGMPGHGGYSGPWSASMKPSETANLIVYYDSTSMPDLYVGQRDVFVDSDDPSTPEYQFTISVHEVP